MNTLYKCGRCHETFEKSWSDEEADAEALDIFGVESASEDPDMAVVCDDCYKALGFGR